jgi:hypothetical protein
MMRPIFYLAVTFVVLTLSTSQQLVHAVDFESFLFNDGNGTELDFAANTANPGNMWTVDFNNLAPAEVENGVYKITKDNDNPASAVLQIANVSTGTRYIVVDISGWAFRGFDSTEPEELRFGFLNEDDGAFSGNTVTAQMQIARNTTTGAVEILGDAVGVGSTDLSHTGQFTVDQSAPVKMVLALDKTSNSYEVFYKDGANPSQSLGLGDISTSRNGNSVRLFANNNFGSDFTEFISVDRIAVTDVNPLTDLMTLEINRISGVMTLINSTGGSLAGLQSYSILSSSGALNSANWKTIAGNYDRASNGGNGSVDIDDAWAVSVSNVGELMESVISGNGGALTVNQPVILSKGDGPWVKSPIEDLYMELHFAGGVTRSANVNFVGNNGKRFSVGDLNFDGQLTSADWTIFIANADANLSGLSEPARYGRGDFNGDGFNDAFDFGLFKNAYIAIHGPGSFEAMLAGVPEPATSGLAAIAAALGFSRRRRSRRFAARLIAAATVLAIVIPSDSATAGILDDFTFSDSNGTVLENAANSVDPSHTWNEDDENEMSPSAVLNGVYRITKANDAIGSNYLNNNNITSGKGYIVAEMSGWNFSSLIGPGEFDSAEPEEVRFAFLNNDTGAQGGSTITGQAIIERNASGGIQLVGKLTTGTPEIAPLPLTLSRSTPFTVVLEIDEDTESFSVWYKDNTNPYALLGTAPHVAGRNGNSVRFYVNNNFSGTGEFFDINRMYVTDTSPFVVNTDKLTLRVKASTGEAWIVNSTATPFTIDLYRIESSANRLSPSGWYSLSDQNYQPVDGDDAGTVKGDGIGETWDEAGGANSGVLSEMFLLGKSAFAANSIPLPIGSPFVAGAQSPLTFQYRDAASGALLSGLVQFVAEVNEADFNNDNIIDGADLLIWQRNLGSAGSNSTGDANSDGNVTSADLAVWKSQFGSPPPTESAVASPTPEPQSQLLALVCGCAICVACSRRIQSANMQATFA